MTYRYDAGKPAGRRIVAVEVGGRPLARDRVLDLRDAVLERRQQIDARELDQHDDVPNGSSLRMSLRVRTVPGS